MAGREQVTGGSKQLPSKERAAGPNLPSLHLSWSQSPGRQDMLSRDRDRTHLRACSSSEQEERSLRRRNIPCCSRKSSLSLCQGSEPVLSWSCTFSLLCWRSRCSAAALGASQIPPFPQGRRAGSGAHHHPPGLCDSSGRCCFALRYSV